MSQLRARESKTQHEGSDSETDVASLEQYINNANDRRSSVRAKANKHLLELVSQRNVAEAETMDQVLDICHGAVEESRDVQERVILTRMATLAMLSGNTHDGFTGEFGEAIGKALPSAIVNPETADLAVVMIHALIIAQAFEENLILATADQLLSSWLLRVVSAPKHSSELRSAVSRLLAATVEDPKDEPFLSAFLVQELDALNDEPAFAAGVVRAVALAFETFGQTDRLCLHLLERSVASTKAFGGKEAKKELDSAVRVCEAFMREGTVPTQTISLVKPKSRNGRSLDFSVETKTFGQLAVLDSIRSVAGSEVFYGLMLESPVLHSYFGVAEPDVEESVHADNFRRRFVARETDYDRLIAAKDRARERSAARDRKRAQ